MSAYLVLDLEILDQEQFLLYRKEVPRFISKHGGEYVVRGGQSEVIEGDWNPKRLVIIRFPDRAAIRSFFADPEYQPLLALRQRSARTNAVAVDAI